MQTYSTTPAEKALDKALFNLSTYLDSDITPPFLIINELNNTIGFFTLCSLSIKAIEYITADRLETEGILSIFFSDFEEFKITHLYEYSYINEDYGPIKPGTVKQTLLGISLGKLKKQPIESTYIAQDIKHLSVPLKSMWSAEIAQAVKYYHDYQPHPLFATVATPTVTATTGDTITITTKLTFS